MVIVSKKINSIYKDNAFSVLYNEVETNFDNYLKNIKIISDTSSNIFLLHNLKSNESLICSKGYFPYINLFEYIILLKIDKNIKPLTDQIKQNELLDNINEININRLNNNNPNIFLNPLKCYDDLVKLFPLDKNDLYYNLIFLMKFNAINSIDAIIKNNINFENKNLDDIIDFTIQLSKILAIETYIKQTDVEIVIELLVYNVIDNFTRTNLVELLLRLGKKKVEDNKWLLTDFLRVFLRKFKTLFFASNMSKTKLDWNLIPEELLDYSYFQELKISEIIIENSSIEAYWYKIEGSSSLYKINESSTFNCNKKYKKTKYTVFDILNDKNVIYHSNFKKRLCIKYYLLKYNFYIKL